MEYRQATDTDLARIEELLRDSNLPFSDCVEHIDNFIIKEENNILVGIGCIEIYGSYGLIRSIAVNQNHRKNGVAKNILKIIRQRAFDSGVTRIYLLTETAIDYFNKLNFKDVKRSDVPDSIKNTKQFKEFCPSSAVVMYSDI